MHRSAGFLAIVSSALVFSAAGAAENLQTYEGPGYCLALPAGWIETVKDDVRSYRNAGAAMTVSVYQLTEEIADSAQRRQLMEKSAALRRASERKLGSGRLTLSAIHLEESADVMQMRYSGEDAGASRRFVNLIVTSPHSMQNFYYEAIGMPAAAFERASQEVFAGLQIRQPPARLASQVMTTRSCSMPTVNCLPAGAASTLGAGLAQRRLLQQRPGLSPLPER